MCIRDSLSPSFRSLSRALARLACSRSHKRQPVCAVCTGGVHRRCAQAVCGVHRRCALCGLGVHSGGARQQPPLCAL
eukprot:2549450-Rhodomonas_salina.1